MTSHSPIRRISSKGLKQEDGIHIAIQTCQKRREMGEKMRKNSKIMINMNSTRNPTKTNSEVEVDQEVEEEEAQIEEIEGQEDTTPEEEDGGGSETTARRKYQ